MSEYDNTNSGALFKNDKGDNEKRPDYTGKLDVDGKEYKLSAWIKSPKIGGGKPFLSLKVQVGNESKPIISARQEISEQDDIPF
jgi:hypothetical protein